MFIMIGISVVIMGSCVVIDQLSKQSARRKLTQVTLQKGYFSFALVKNKGAFRGILKDNKQLLLVIQVVSMLIIGLMLGFFMNKKDKTTTVGLSLILGGAIGNLLDRVKDGYVTDFFAIKWTKDLYYNLADMFIFLGAIILMVREFFRPA